MPEILMRTADASPACRWGCVERASLRRKSGVSCGRLFERSHGHVWKRFRTAASRITGGDGMHSAWHGGLTSSARWFGVLSAAAHGQVAVAVSHRDRSARVAGGGVGLKTGELVVLGFTPEWSISQLHGSLLREGSRSITIFVLVFPIRWMVTPVRATGGSPTV